MTTKPQPLPDIAGLQMDANLLRKGRGERCILTECQAACCVNGIWADVNHVQKILAHAEAIKPYLAEQYRNEDAWFGEEILEHSDFPSGLGIPTQTGSMDGHPGRSGCVLLRSDYKCGLQVASLALGLGYPGLKPFDCASYPILRSEGALQVDDASPAQLGGADCQRPCAGEPQRMFEIFREEVELSLGAQGFARLAAAAGEGRRVA